MIDTFTDMLGKQVNLVNSPDVVIHIQSLYCGVSYSTLSNVRLRSYIILQLIRVDISKHASGKSKNDIKHYSCAYVQELYLSLLSANHCSM